MSFSKGHVVLFFERNPALREHSAEILAEIPDSNWVLEGDIRRALGAVLFDYFLYDQRYDEPLRGKPRVMGHKDSYLSVTMSYVT